MSKTTTRQPRKSKGIELKIARLRTGQKQYQVAAKVGITPTQLCEIEGGRRQPSPKLLQAILKVVHGKNDQEQQKRRT